MTSSLQGRRELLLRLFDHARWANEEVYKALQGADSVPEKVLTLLSHLASSEKVWLERLNGRDTSGLKIWPEITLEDCEQFLRENAEKYKEYLSRLSDGELDTLITYRSSQGVEYSTYALDILNHVALHGSYHRGQIMTHLRLNGEEPVGTDYILFARADRL